MNYATGYAFNTKEIFENFDWKRIKSVGSIYENKDGKTCRRDHKVISVFLYAVKLILIDIFKNNITFHLPTGRKSRIKMKQVTGDDFIKARRNGAYQDIDYMESDFTAYSPIFEYYSRGVVKTKDIHVNKGLQEIYIDNINNGMKYF